MSIPITELNMELHNYVERLLPKGCELTHHKFTMYLSEDKHKIASPCMYMYYSVLNVGCDAFILEIICMSDVMPLF